MIPGLVQNGAAASRAYPQAAQKSQMDAKLLEKQGNEEIADRQKADTSAVATRPKPVQAGEEGAAATLDHHTSEAFPRAPEASAAPKSLGLSVYA